MTVGVAADSRAEGSNFLVAFRVLDAVRRRGIETVYGLCRTADDAADEAVDEAAGRRRLEEVERSLDRVFRGRPKGEGERRLLWAVEEFRLPRRPFDLLLEGIRWDLEGRRYRTIEELRAYCRRVASSVGLLCVRIFGCPAPRCDAYAEELGVAMQWTNILRDVGTDLARGRIYLPERSLRRHDLDEACLRRAGDDDRRRLAEVIREEAAYARACFAAAGRALPVEERPRVLAGEIMAAVYRGLLGKVERAGDGVLDEPVSLSRARHAAIAFRVLLGEQVRAARRAIG